MFFLKEIPKIRGDKMKNNIFIMFMLALVGLSFLLGCSSPDKATEYELPLHQERLSEKVITVWTSDYMQTIAVVALATEKGMVVIETSLSRTNDARIRRVIEKAFGRDDFKYLINTHYHHDHTSGNQIYSDATIIAHKNLPKGMKEELTGDGLVKLVEKFKSMLESWGEGLKHTEPGFAVTLSVRWLWSCQRLLGSREQKSCIPMLVLSPQPAALLIRPIMEGSPSKEISG